MDIASIIIISIVMIAVINTIYSTRYKIVNMPSAPQTRGAIIEDIQKQKGECENLNIYDCGSGWGGLCRKLAKSFPKASVVGIEISPIPFLVSFFTPWRGYQLTHQDLFKRDLSDADVVIFYLSPYHADRLADKLRRELKKGALVYSQGFPLQGWQVSKEINVPYSLEKKLYRYEA